MRNVPSSWIWIFILAVSFAGFASANVNSFAQEVGRVTVLWGDGPPGSGIQKGPLAILTTTNGQRFELVLENDKIDLQHGIRGLAGRLVEVKGEVEPSTKDTGKGTGERHRLIVESLSIMPEPFSGAGEQKIEGNKPWVSILCKFADHPLENEPPSYFEAMYTIEPPGIDHYWREASFNEIDLRGSSAVGWYTIDEPSDAFDSSNLGALAEACAAAADDDVDFTRFFGMNIFLNGNIGCCAWGGRQWLTLDDEYRSWPITWMPAWSWTRETSTVVHEMGHAFGMPHSRVLSGDLYANVWDVMSDNPLICAAPDPKYGCLAQHPNAYHKDLVGWIPPHLRTDVAPETAATITLDRLAQPGGDNPLLMVVPTRHEDYAYTVELRQQVGAYDSGLPAEGIIIHELKENRAQPTQLVDFDFNDDASDAAAYWVPGERFLSVSDGVGVRVDSMTDGSAVVTAERHDSMTGFSVDWWLAENVAVTLIPVVVGSTAESGWVSDLTIFDSRQSGSFAYFLQQDRGNHDAPVEAVRMFESGQGWFSSLRIPDVVEALFTPADTKGALLIGSWKPILAMSRTAISSGDGSVGQLIPGIPLSNLDVGPTEIRLIGLAEDSDSRTNLGLVNAGPEAAMVVVDYLDDHGMGLMSTSHLLSPFGMHQENSPLAHPGIGPIHGATAVVRTSQSNARITAYASIVNQRSSDPVLVPPLSSISPSPAAWSIEEIEGIDYFSAVASGDGRTVALGYEGIDIITATSTDGGAWELTVNTGIAAGSYIEKMTYGAGHFAAVGCRFDSSSGSCGGAIFLSPDGRRWSPVLSGGEFFPYLMGINWADGKFIAVGDAGAIFVSADGFDWKAEDPGALGQGLWFADVAWNGREHVVVGQAGIALTSWDGQTWYRRSTGLSHHLWRLTWAGKHFVGVGGDGQIVTSPNGHSRTWSNRHDREDHGTFWGIAAANGIVAAVADNAAFMSLDGIDWRWSGLPINDNEEEIFPAAITMHGSDIVAVTWGGQILRSLGRAYVPGVSHAPGEAGTTWQTTLDVHNPGHLPLDLEIAAVPFGWTSTATTALAAEVVHVPPQGSVRIDDVLHSVFGVTGSATLRCTAHTGQAMIAARTSNVTESGLLSQLIPAFSEFDTGLPDQGLRVIGLIGSAASGEGFRSNIGVVNLSPHSLELTIEIRAADDSELETLIIDLAAWQSRQMNNLIRTDLDAAYAVIESDNPEARFYAYGSVIDNRTGDPIYIPGRRW